MKVLLAEDEDHIGQMVQFKLERAGLTVVWKTDGEAALEAIRTEQPDLALLDVMMPGLDGFEVLDRIKQDDALKAIPVIMLTARGQERDVVRGLELGAADYVVKPFRPAELLARVQRILGQGA